MVVLKNFKGLIFFLFMSKRCARAQRLVVVEGKKIMYDRS